MVKHLAARAFVCLFGLAAGLSAAAPANADSLGAALSSAYLNSGLLDQNRALLRAADEDVAVAVAALRPVLSWSTGLTRRFSHQRSNGVTLADGNTEANVGLTASLLLHDFGRSQLAIEAAKENVLATRQGLVSLEQQVLFRAVQAYMEVIRASEIVALRQGNLRLLNEQLRATEDRFEVGEVTRTDVAQAQARVAAAKAGAAAAGGDLDRAREEFRAAIGRAPGTLATPSRLPDLPDTVAAAKAIAQRNHPEIKRAQHNIKAAELNVAVAEAATRPSVNLFGNLGVTRDLERETTQSGAAVGVEMSAPIYQGGRLPAQQRRAMALRDAQRANLHVVSEQVAQNVGNAYAILGATLAGRRANEEAVRAATIAFRGVKEETLLGARTTLDVLDAEQELLNARTELIAANVDVVAARYAVLAALGQLTAQDLRLDVPIYDPNSYYDLVKTAPSASSPQGQQLDRVLRALGKD